MDSQTELFPFFSPATVIAYCRRIEAMVLKVAPELTEDQCGRLLADLSISTLLLQETVRTIERSKEWQLRQQLPDTSETMRAAERIAFSQIGSHYMRRGRRGPSVNSST